MFYNPAKPLFIDGAAEARAAHEEHMRVRRLISDFWESVYSADRERAATLETERIAKGLDHPEWV